MQCSNSCFVHFFPRSPALCCCPIVAATNSQRAVARWSTRMDETRLTITSARHDLALAIDIARERWAAAGAWLLHRSVPASCTHAGWEAVCANPARLVTMACDSAVLTETATGRNEFQRPDRRDECPSGHRAGKRVGTFKEQRCVCVCVCIHVPV
jgi:hypothetical protein